MPLLGVLPVSFSGILLELEFLTRLAILWSESLLFVKEGKTASLMKVPGLVPAKVELRRMERLYGVDRPKTRIFGYGESASQFQMGRYRS